MDLLTKTFEGHDIRLVSDNETVLFVASDVAKTLGYKEPHKAVTRHCKGGMKRPVLTSGGMQEMLVIREPDVYRLVTNSKLPAAEKFEMWVMEEVLPSIRKHGGYLTPEKVEEALLNPDTLIRLATDLKEERQKRLDAEQIVEAQKPKVLFADAVSTSETSILIGQLAKLITQNGHAIGQNRLFHWMRQNNYLGRSGQHYNEPTQYAMERGWFEVKERTVNNPDGSVRITRTTKVTGKGQVYFINKFLNQQEVI